MDGIGLLGLEEESERPRRGPRAGPPNNSSSSAAGRSEQQQPKPPSSTQQRPTRHSNHRIVEETSSSSASSFKQSDSTSGKDNNDSFGKRDEVKTGGSRGSKWGLNAWAPSPPKSERENSSSSARGGAEDSGSSDQNIENSSSSSSTLPEKNGSGNSSSPGRSPERKEKKEKRDRKSKPSPVKRVDSAGAFGDFEWEGAADDLDLHDDIKRKTDREIEVERRRMKMAKKNSSNMKTAPTEKDKPPVVQSPSSSGSTGEKKSTATASPSRNSSSSSSSTVVAGTLDANGNELKEGSIVVENGLEYELMGFGDVLFKVPKRKERVPVQRDNSSSDGSADGGSGLISWSQDSAFADGTPSGDQKSSSARSRNQDDWIDKSLSRRGSLVLALVDELDTPMMVKEGSVTAPEKTSDSLAGSDRRSSLERGDPDGSLDSNGVSGASAIVSPGGSSAGGDPLEGSGNSSQGGGGKAVAPVLLMEDDSLEQQLSFDPTTAPQRNNSFNQPKRMNAAPAPMSFGDFDLSGGGGEDSTADRDGGDSRRKAPTQKSKRAKGAISPSSQQLATTSSSPMGGSSAESENPLGGMNFTFGDLGAVFTTSLPMNHQGGGSASNGGGRTGGGRGTSPSSMTDSSHDSSNSSSKKTQGGAGPMSAFERSGRSMSVRRNSAELTMSDGLSTILVKRFFIKGFKPFSTIGHAGKVRGLVSCDGKDNLIVSVGGDELTATGRRRDVTTMQPSRFASHSDIVLQISVSIDGRFIATAGNDGTLFVHDTHTFKRVAMMKHPGPVTCSAFAENGRFVVSGCHDGACRLFSTKGEGPLRVASVHGDASVETVALQPHGEYAASGGSDGTLKLWRSASGLTCPLDSTSSKGRRTLLHVVFANGGQWLLSLDPTTLVITDVKTGVALASIHSKSISCDGYRLRKKNGVTGKYMFASCTLLPFSSVFGWGAERIAAKNAALREETLEAMDTERMDDLIVLAGNDKVVRVFSVRVQAPSAAPPDGAAGLGTSAGSVPLSKITGGVGGGSASGGVGPTPPPGSKQLGGRNSSLSGPSSPTTTTTEGVPPKTLKELYSFSTKGIPCVLNAGKGSCLMCGDTNGNVYVVGIDHSAALVKPNTDEL